MGLMLAATGGALPDLTWLYFALAQFPIYLLPYFLSPLARRLISPPPPAAQPPKP
jgi:BASS family bile acid:Na+ symporter